MVVRCTVYTIVYAAQVNKKLNCRWQTARRIYAITTWRGWTHKTCPSPYMSSRRIW